jgi:hypothetical protein
MNYVQVSQPAVEDLEFLRNTTPEESNVVFQLPTLLGANIVKSAQMLAVAPYIAPESRNKIKKPLETVKDETIVLRSSHRFIGWLSTLMKQPDAICCNDLHHVSLAITRLRLYPVKT